MESQANARDPQPWLIESAARSDLGLVRHENQDTYGAFPELGLYLVADGVSGHVGGGVASDMVVEEIRRALEAGGHDPPPGTDASGGGAPVARRLMAAGQRAPHPGREGRREAAAPGRGS